MKIYKTLVTLGEDGFVYTMDTIMDQGRMWLVPKWLESLETGGRRPERMILLDTIPHQKVDPLDMPNDQVHYILSDPIPKEVVENGQVPIGLEDVYVVVEAPQIGPKPDEPRH